MALVNRNIVSIPHPSDPRQPVEAVDGFSKVTVIILAFALLFALVGTAAAAPQYMPKPVGPTDLEGDVVDRAPAAMTHDATEQVIERFFNALEAGSFSRFLSTDAVLTRGSCGETVFGRADVAGAISSVCHGAFEGQLTVDEAIVGAGFAAVDGTVFATQVAPFNGIAPSDLTVVIPYSASFDLAGGQIVRVKLDIPMEAVVHQLNARDVPPWNPGQGGMPY